MPANISYKAANRNPRISWFSQQASMPPLKPQALKPQALKPKATYDDFARFDIRIGKVADVQPFPRARNPSWKVGVDVGADRIMWSSAQITNYEPAMPCPLRRLARKSNPAAPHAAKQHDGQIT
jgi:hypothetical protein